jgi:hypothetical protein
VIHIILISEPESLKRCTDSFQSVYNFLRGIDTTVSAGQSTRRPLLVCGDSWTLRQRMSDQGHILDDAGRDIDAINEDGEPMSVADIGEYAAYYERLSLMNSRELFPVSQLPIR